MAAKISHTGASPQVAGRTTAAPAIPAKNAPEGVAAPQPSREPRYDGRLRELSRLILNAPEVDETRVAGIKQALTRGAYPLEPRLIAERLIAFERRIDNL